MAKSRKSVRAAEWPARRPRISPDAGHVFAALGDEEPVLALALARARRELLPLTGVCGVGIGRPYSERRRQYWPKSRAWLGLAIRVYVEKKRRRVAPSARLPSVIEVFDPCSERTVEVPVDVVSAAGIGARRSARPRLNAGREWPTAGTLQPGRLFAYGRDSAAQTPARLDYGRTSLGTLGAMVRMQDQRLFAISAGHVFTRPCADEFRAPSGARAVGAHGATWDRTVPGAFYPATTRVGARVRDVMAFEPPSSLCGPIGAWPPGFLGELATYEDYKAAVLATSTNAFTWVERNGVGVGVPADLEAALSDFQPPLNCGGVAHYVPYTLTWPLRFTTASTTIGGDSGAGVFVRATDRPGSRLLAFHFMEWGDKSYAIDARTFFEAVFGGLPGSTFDFA